MRLLVLLPALLLVPPHPALHCPSLSSRVPDLLQLCLLQPLCVGVPQQQEGRALGRWGYPLRLLLLLIPGLLLVQALLVQLLGCQCWRRPVLLAWLLQQQ